MAGPRFPAFRILDGPAEKRHQTSYDPCFVRRIRGLARIRPCSGRPRNLKHVFAPHRCRHSGRRMPSRFAITDNGSGRAGSGPRAWARLYCIHIQSCGSWPPRLNQSRAPCLCASVGAARSAPRRPRWRCGSPVRWPRIRAPPAVAPRAGSGKSCGTSRWRRFARNRATICRRAPGPRATLATDRRHQNPGVTQRI